MAALAWLLGAILPAGVVKVLLMVYLVLINGAMHLDGVESGLLRIARRLRKA